jgi:pimeloyl-ACP methyl ester carboxylesterase
MSDSLAEIDPFSPAEIARVSRRITLPDGRGLGYAEFGPAEGPPVLYFHGWPSSRLEPAILVTAGIRIISVDRPGYGISDAVTGRRPRKLADWPRDIGCLLKTLGIGRFALFGMSGGAPYAAAVAAAMPDRVAGLALVAGLGPPESAGMRQGRAGLLLGFGRARLSRHIVFNAARRALLDEQNETRLLAIRRRFVSRLQRDNTTFDGEFGRRMMACWREGLRRGIEGAASDARIYGEPWPFDVASIKVPLDIWHGEEDHIVPCAVGRAYAAALPRAQTFFMPGEGHVSLVTTHLDDILDRLLARL